MFRLREVPLECLDWLGEGVWLPPILGLVVGFKAPWEEVLVVPGWVVLGSWHWQPFGPHFEWPTWHDP